MGVNARVYFKPLACVVPSTAGELGIPPFIMTKPLTWLTRQQAAVGVESFSYPDADKLLLRFQISRWVSNKRGMGLILNGVKMF